jgi:hypothetical protein
MTAAQCQQRRRDKAKALGQPALDLMRQTQEEEAPNPNGEPPTPDKMTALLAIRDRVLPDAARAQSAEESELAITLYDELTNLAMGRGLSLCGSAVGDNGRWVIAVDGALDLVALAQRVLQVIRDPRWQAAFAPPQTIRSDCLRAWNGAPPNASGAIAAAIPPWQGGSRRIGARAQMQPVYVGTINDVAVRL